MRLSRSEVAWVIWSALLAVMPYFAENVLFSPDMRPMPGQLNELALGLALLAVLLLRRMQPYFGVGASKVGPALGCLGAIASTALIAVEVLLGLNRGYPYLDEAQAALYQVLMPLEIACSTVAVLGWVVWAQCMEGSEERAGWQEFVPSFVLGFTWCCACALLGKLQWFGGFAIGPFLASGAIALILSGAALRRGGLGRGTVPSFVTGWLALLLIKGAVFVGAAEYPQEVVLAVSGLIGGIFLAMLAVWARSLWMRRMSDHEPTTEMREDDRGERISAHLSNFAVKPLTGRESEILTRTVLGEPAGDIAKALGIAEATVASYRRRGYQKLGVSGAAQLRELAAELTCHECVGGGSGEPATVMDSCQSVAATSNESDQDARNVSVTRVALLESAFSIVCSFLLAAHLHSLWMGYRGLGVDLIALIVLPPWLFVRPGRADNRAGVSALRQVVDAFLTGFVRVYLSGLTPACFVAALAVSDGVARTFFSGYSSLYIPILSGATLLTTASFLYLAVSGMRDSRHDVVRLSESREERALHYLRGRGLGELQARVVLDLACGYDVARVAKSRFTTVATVRSYRRRSLDTLGLNNIDELRKLLSSEAGFTSKGEVHPVK